MYIYISEVKQDPHIHITSIKRLMFTTSKYTSSFDFERYIYIYTYCIYISTCLCITRTCIVLNNKNLSRYNVYFW